AARSAHAPRSSQSRLVFSGRDGRRSRSGAARTHALRGAGSEQYDGIGAVKQQRTQPARGCDANLCRLFGGSFHSLEQVCGQAHLDLSRDGTTCLIRVVGYNVQVAVDTEHDLIVAHEVTNSGSERAQLANIASQAKAVLVENSNVLISSSRRYST